MELASLTTLMRKWMLGRNWIKMMEKLLLKMHFFDKIKTKNGRLEGNYFLILRQYLCYGKYIISLVPSSFVVVVFLLVNFLLQLFSSSATNFLLQPHSYYSYPLVVTIVQWLISNKHFKNWKLKKIKLN